MKIETGSRLHFGLLGWGPELPRQFGGVGLMIEDPALEITAQQAQNWQATGPLSERALRIAQTLAHEFDARGAKVAPLAIEIIRAPREHTGLGVGTQLSLAVARLIAEQVGLGALPAIDLARLTGRGLRSGIGLHGFDRGGLIADAGHAPDQGKRPPPLLAAQAFPSDWNILLVTPDLKRGRHGQEEYAAFQSMPAVSLATHERLCRLLVMGILPAVAEADLSCFGATLEAFQQEVGATFATAQGGTFGHPQLAELVHAMKQADLVGVGQSSWGPTLYGFTNQSPDELTAFTRKIQEQYQLDAQGLIWTQARQRPAIISR